ncbi:MAG: MarR family transcriptional regulator [Actinomycetota bacterium]
MTVRRPLSFDPIAEAARNWQSAGWEDTAQGMALVTSIMRAHQIFIAAVDATLSPMNLTFARFEVLMLLDFTRTGRLPLSKIGQRLQVHPASVTNAIDRLEKAGLVERLPHPTDGRTTLAAITDQGRRLARRAAAALNAGPFADVGMSDQAIGQVVGALAGLRRHAGDFVEKPGAPAR